ncbi:MAG: flagellar export chaperone FlgN [Tepidisphaeraceae bacterium]
MDARLINQVLVKLVELYERLLKLAAQQHACVADERTDDLLDVLGQRQGVVEQIVKLEAALRPTKQNWASLADVMPAEQRADAERLMARSRDLLEQITAADNDDAMLLQQRKLNVGRQLAATSTGARVNQRYAASAYGTATPVRVDVSR